MVTITSPQAWEGTSKTIFLAGSIEMGKAVDWQTQVVTALADTDLTLLNPRRADWDSSWVQEISNPQFNEQVSWELGALEVADLIVMYFAPGTYSPITLLEMGIHARSGKLIVCCPDGFWRKGNVDIVCHRYGVPQVQTLEELVQAIRRHFGH